MEIPLLIGLLGLRLTLAIPWSDLDLPSISWPDWDLPSIPWPDLPAFTAPAWVVWLADRVRYIWPAVLAGVLAGGGDQAAAPAGRAQGAAERRGSGG